MVHLHDRTNAVTHQVGGLEGLQASRNLFAARLGGAGYPLGAGTRPPRTPPLHKPCYRPVCKGSPSYRLRCQCEGGTVMPQPEYAQASMPSSAAASSMPMQVRW